MRKDNNSTCSKCKEDFIYYDNETYWDNKGYGYSTKLVKCPYCDATNILRYKDDNWLK